MANRILEGNPKNLFIRYFFASFGGAFVVSIYALVDSVCVGQFHGELGSAALAVVMPLWTIIYSLGLLFGVGGSVLMTNARGRGDEKAAHKIFTLTLVMTGAVALAVWLLLFAAEDPLLSVFGGNDPAVRALAKRYCFWMKLGVPVFMATQTLSCFVRCDGAPLRATTAVIVGGAFNVAGDLIFVFGLKTGIYGAGMATFIGQCLTTLTLLSHFLSKKNTLRLDFKSPAPKAARRILALGIPAFLVDISMGVVIIAFNNQIAVRIADERLRTSTLAVYGVVGNLIGFAQAFSYAVGQSAQPLVSQNYGAAKMGRVRALNRYAIAASLLLSALLVIGLSVSPNALAGLFIRATEGSLVADIAPRIMRVCFLSFAFSVVNVYFIYYFQAIMRPSASLAIVLSRGFLLPLAGAFLLPLIRFDLIWYALVLADGLTAVLSVCLFAAAARRLRSVLPDDRKP